jgi:hypothetical protein
MVVPDQPQVLSPRGTLQRAKPPLRKEATMMDRFGGGWPRARFPGVTGRREAVRALGTAVMTGLAGRAASPVPIVAKKKKTKRKRCKEKKRTFCAGRCCPKQHRCEHGACVRSCADPCSSGQSGGSCVSADPCFCATSITGKPARLKAPANAYCPANPPCSPTNLCPSGRVCATCGCGASSCNYRCFDPCPAG